MRIFAAAKLVHDFLGIRALQNSHRAAYDFVMADESVELGLKFIGGGGCRAGQGQRGRKRKYNERNFAQEEWRFSYKSPIHELLNRIGGPPWSRVSAIIEVEPIQT